MRFVLIAVALAFIVAVAAVVDCVLSARADIAVLPKPVWILLSIVVPIVGPLLWFVFGKKRGRSAQPQVTGAPDDDDDFLRGIDVESRIAEAERELREQGKTDGDDNRPTSGV